MEDISLVLHLIDLCLFAGYGLYTFVWIVVSLRYRNNSLIKGIDKSANYIAAISGLSYFVLWIIGLWISLNDPEQGDYLRRRLSGPYAFGIWLPPALLFVASQLLWIPYMQKQKLIRLILGFLLFLSIEKFVIITTSLHRDYLPSSWSMVNEGVFGVGGYFFTLIADLFIRLVFYIALSYAAYFLYKRLRNKRLGS